MIKHKDATIAELPQRLAKQFAIGIRVAAAELDRLAGQADHSFHIRLRVIDWAAEDGHFPATGSAKLIDTFIDEEPVAGKDNRSAEIDAASIAVGAREIVNIHTLAVARFADDDGEPATRACAFAVIAEKCVSHAAGGHAEGFEKESADDEEEDEKRDTRMQHAADGVNDGFAG